MLALDIALQATARAERGLTGRYLRERRLEQAAQLLRNDVGSVSEIAYSVGFASVSHSSKSFRDRYSVSPTVHSQ